MKPLLSFLFLAGLLLTGADLPAAERIPPAPSRHFNDYAGIVSGPVANQLDARLAQFERDSSSQLLVVIYPKMESDSSVEDYTVRVAQSWGVGQQGRNNGAVLFAFMASRDLYLQVGYGLEGAIPDATAKRIIEQEIVPRFRQRDFDGGMTAAVNAMIAAAKGEYKGTGRTVAEQHGRAPGRPAPGGFVILIVIFMFLGVPAFFIFIIVRAIRAGRTATLFNNPRRVLPRDTWWVGPGRPRSGGSIWTSSGGGSSWGGGGGGFSGGGGSFGGGGAGGKW